MRAFTGSILLTWCAMVALAARPARLAAAEANKPFTIEVVDAQTGRGVPLVELRSVDSVVHVTDSAGIVALREAELMGRRAFFYVESHGYEFPADGFGFRGKALDVVPGGHARLEIERRNVAERLYRVTGAGIYRDSLLVGRAAPIREPLLNAEVTGSDSVQVSLYRGRLYWFWGDTNRPRYPLGNFHVPGATSAAPGPDGLDPDRGIDLEYFVDDEGFAKRTCEMPGDGPTWIEALCVVPDADGRERMFAAYMKVRGFLEVYRRGLARFDDERAEFVHVADIPLEAPIAPHGRAQRREVDDQEYVYFGNPYPTIRVPARADAIADLAQYEAYTCLAPGSRLRVPGRDGVQVAQARVERDAAGHVVWTWKKDAPPLTADDEARLIAAGKLKADEALFALRDVETCKPVTAHAGNVAWNEHRRAWTMIAQEVHGTSHLGEIWYAEADSALGPWVYARKVVTHDKYSFYNPRLHRELSQEGGRLLYFEGTYSTFLSGNDHPTPRYDYNQVMYRLDLSDPRLTLPTAVHRTRKRGAAGDAEQRDVEHLARAAPGSKPSGEVAFFAMPRAAEGLVPLYAQQSATGDTRLTLEPTTAGEAGRTEPLGYVVPSETPAKETKPGEAEPAASAVVPLYAWRHAETGAVRYSTESLSKPYRRDAASICRVWPTPLRGPSRWE